ncbi:hypothetical protein PHLCEN_2v4505 [Hermanssonia centrifuga]|uniref:DNA damage-binding protein CMR1 n=1 Tax=Hermanssonia centrifuga TaxID=98765 RepID=A0A2R6PNA4_9APHY|nr:hypothetical protein PHLCEN_2v4505 [Hermanssonia centrifuga]
MSDFEQEREANIARNRALLAELDVSLVIPKKEPPIKKDKAKPVQPVKRVKREPVTPAPVRQSARLKRSAPDPAESPAKRRKREQDDEKIRRQQEQERLETEERAREAKKPRHQNLKLTELLEDTDAEDSTLLTAAFQDTMEERGVGSQTEFVFDEEQQEREVSELKKKLKGMKVIARAKVTQDRVYSAAYHPDRTKDLIFFGDKHGQLGIWDARAPSDEADNGDDEESSKRDDAESGKYWRLQLHWPATSKSSISTIKFDPIDSHSVSSSFALRAKGEISKQRPYRYSQVRTIAQFAVYPSLPECPEKYTPTRTLSYLRSTFHPTEMRCGYQTLPEGSRTSICEKTNRKRDGISSLNRRSEALV